MAGMTQIGVKCSLMRRTGAKMKSHTEYLTFNLPERMGFENITPQIEAIVRRSGVARGWSSATRCTSRPASSSTTTSPACTTIIRSGSSSWPRSTLRRQRYHHNRTGEDNADAHLKRQVMGREVVVAITKGKLDFGPWEQIFYGEFDGRRPKRVLVKVIGE